MKRLRSTNLEEIFRVLQFGLPKQKATIYELRSGNLEDIPNPVFFLSTGRCGTAWFSKLISSDKTIKALHNPTPTLAIQSRLAFNYLYKLEANDKIQELLKEIFLAGREAQLRYSYKTKRRIVETNNGITFFSPVLAELFPNAKFVHLIRNPYEFINSGFRRRYYSGSTEDLRRITTDKVFDLWDNTDQIVKIAWLWSATNDFIYDFSKRYPDRTYSFNFSNDLNPQKVNDLMSFLEINIPENRIQRLISKPVNIQKGGSEINHKKWSDKQKEQVRNLLDDLIGKVDFN